MGRISLLKAHQTRHVFFIVMLVFSEVFLEMFLFFNCVLTMFTFSVINVFSGV